MDHFSAKSHPSSIDPWIFFHEIHLASVPASEYWTKTGHNYLQNPEYNWRGCPASIHVDSSLDLNTVWPWSISPILLSKYWIQVWRYLLNGQYTNLITSHFIPGQSTNCTLCNAEHEDVVHWFHSCPYAVISFWNLVFEYLIPNLPDVLKTIF